MALKYKVRYTRYRYSGLATGLSFFFNGLGILFGAAGLIALVAVVIMIIECVKGAPWSSNIGSILLCAGGFLAAVAYVLLDIFVLMRLTDKIAAIAEAEQVRAETPLEPEGRPCSMCGKMIDKQAAVCPHCGYERPKL